MQDHPQMYELEQVMVVISNSGHRALNKDAAIGVPREVCIDSIVAMVA